MENKRYNKILGISLFLWGLVFLSSVFDGADDRGVLESPVSKAVARGIGTGGDMGILSTYTTCDTSIDSTVLGLDKPNQSKVFFLDSSWYMVAKRPGSPERWNLFRYDSVRSWTVILEDTTGKQKDRPDVYMDYANNLLYVFFSSNYTASTPSSLIKIAYNPADKSWTPNFTKPVPVVRSGADTPASFLKDPDGNLWVFSAIDSNVIALMSNDDGVSWSDTIFVSDSMTTAFGLTDAAVFTSNSGLRYIGLGVAENSDTLSQNFFYLHELGTDSTVWIDESNNVAAVGLERADDHINIVVDTTTNILYMVTKTSGNGPNAPENVLYVRSPDSTWANYTVIETSNANDPDAFTRPALVIDKSNDSLYVFGTLSAGDNVSGRPLQYKRCALGEESSLELQTPTTVMINSADTYQNTSVPFHTVWDSTELMIIAENVTQANVWFNRLGIGPTTYPACPSYIDTTIKNFHLTKSGSDLVLTWDDVVEADSFVIYRGSKPMFSPDTARLASTTDTTYTDVAVLGTPGDNKFYMVRAYVAGSPGPLSERHGKVEYDLLAPAELTKSNFVSLALEDTAITMASDFVDRLGGNSDLVSTWIDTSQAFSAYTPGLSFTDFAVSPNDVIFISVVSADTLCLIGKVPTGHTYSLIKNTDKSSNNDIMVLMDTDTITTASQLETSIGPVDLVSKWVATTQGWQAYTPGLSFTDFSVYPGMPLHVSMTADTTWPAR